MDRMNVDAPTVLVPPRVFESRVIIPPEVIVPSSKVLKLCEGKGM